MSLYDAIEHLKSALSDQGADKFSSLWIDIEHASLKLLQNEKP